MRDRLGLHNLLVSSLGNNNVYFQPPESLKISYPCIIYNLSNIESGYADDRSYTTSKIYNITLIHKNPENDVVDKLMEFKMINFDRSFQSEGLYHYVFSIAY